MFPGKKYVITILLLILHLPDELYGQIPCSGIDELNQVLRVKETDANVILQNVTTSPGENWNFSINGVNQGMHINQARNILRSYFSILIQGQSRMLLNLTRAINKEFLVTVIPVNDIARIDIKIECTVNSSNIPSQITILVDSVNEVDPVFEGSPYTVLVPEDTPVDAVVYTFVNITDGDVPKPPFFYLEMKSFGNSATDGAKYFYFAKGTSNEVRLRAPVDYDAFDRADGSHFYTTYVLAKDALDSTARTGTTAIYFNITDVDDLPPKFTLPQCNDGCAPVYTARAMTTFPAKLDIQPQPIKARDQDTMNFSVIYSLKNDSSNFFRCFSINPATGEVYQQLESEAGVLIIQATENSTRRRYSEATLRIAKDVSLNTTYVPPSVQRSTAGSNDSNKIIIVVIAVIAFIIIAVLVILFVVYYKRQRKSINPSRDPRPDSPTDGELTPDGNSRSQSKLDLLAAQFYPTPTGKKNQLPPLVTHDMSIGTEDFKKKRSRKRKKKELEIFDGTVTYEMEADPEFYASKDKSKIKRSARNIKENKLDLKYWITVQDGYQEY